jgi:hypothetical protein
MSITTIETKIKATVTALLGPAKADIAKIEAITADIVADIRRITTRTALIGFGIGFGIGVIAKALI